MAELSMPPERNAPYGTSLTIRILTAVSSSPGEGGDGIGDRPVDGRRKAVGRGIEARLRQRAMLPQRIAAGHQLADAREESMRGRNIAVEQIVGDRGAVEGGMHIPKGQQCLDLRTEKQLLPVLIYVERLLAELIAGQHQPAAGMIPQSEGEHAAQPRHAIRAPFDIGIEQHFGVGLGAEAMALSFELLAQQFEIVDLAVEDERDARALMHHGLDARRQIDDRQAPMRQADEG